MGGALAMQLSRELLVPSVVFNPAAVSTKSVLLLWHLLRGGTERVYQEIASTAVVERGVRGKPALIAIHAVVGDPLPAPYFVKDNDYTLVLHPLMDENPGHSKTTHGFSHFFALPVDNNSNNNKECELSAPAAAPEVDPQSQTALRLAQCTVNTLYPSSPFLRAVGTPFLPPALSAEPAATMDDLDEADELVRDFYAAADYFSVYRPGTVFDAGSVYETKLLSNQAARRKNNALYDAQQQRRLEDQA